MDTPAPLPLEGLRVVERAGRLAGGVCALLLRELGASVVRLEAPDDPPPLALEAQPRANLDALLRLGRCRVRYDAEAWAELLARADVAVLAPPGPLDPRELEQLRAAGGRVVGCVITPYGLEGPAEGVPPAGDELTVQALAGLMGTTGALDGPPMPNGVPVAELVAGLHAAIATLAALRVRDAGGGGQIVAVALFDTLVSMMGTFAPLVLAGRVGGLRQGCRHPLIAPWNAYPAADGRVLICTTTDAQWHALLRLAGREECLADPAFASAAERARHVEAVDALVSAWSATLTSAELIAVLTGAGVAAGAIGPIPELMGDADLRERGVIRAVRDDADRMCWVAGVSWMLTGTADGALPDRVEPLHAHLPPGLWPEAPAVPAPGRRAPRTKAEAPLRGVRVLELGLLTAGPMAGRHLAALGAEVIKIEPLAGESSRGWQPASDGTSHFFSNNNCGKRSLALDLKQAQGSTIAARLAGACDVVLENMRPGALQRLGLDYKHLRREHPALIYCSVTGYGQRGARAGKAAYDTVIQAESGLMALLGGDEPVKVGVSIADLMGAAFAPLAILAALRRRERDGQGRHIDLSLLDSTAWLTQLSWPDGAASLPPWQRLEGGDGYVLVQGTPQAIHAALGGDGAHGTTCDALVARLTAAGLPAVRIPELDAVLAGPQVACRGLLLRQPDARGNAVPLLAPVHRLSRTPARITHLLDGPGADTDAILAELGYAPADIADLRRLNVVR